MLATKRPLMDSGWRNILRKVPSSSVLYYPALPEGFDASTIKDYSGNANNGTISGATWVKLPSGLWVLSFDGTDDTCYKSSPSFINDTQGSLELWFKLAATNADYIVSSISVEGAFDDEFLFLYYRGTLSNQIQLLLLVNALTSAEFTTANSVVTDTNWHHWRLTSDVSTIKAYLDDAEKTLTATSGTNSGQWMASATQADVFTLGAIRRATPVVDFNGRIALPKVFDAVVASHREQERHLFGV